MRHVQMLLTILTAIIFSGCSHKECKPVLIPQKCIVPITQEPEIDNIPCLNNEYSCVVGKALRNYEAQKSYAKELKNNNEVCK
jgi:hypothetical protein